MLAGGAAKVKGMGGVLRKHQRCGHAWASSAIAELAMKCYAEFPAAAGLMLTRFYGLLQQVNR